VNIVNTKQCSCIILYHLSCPTDGFIFLPSGSHSQGPGSRKQHDLRGARTLHVMYVLVNEIGDVNTMCLCLCHML